MWRDRATFHPIFLTHFSSEVLKYVEYVVGIEYLFPEAYSRIIFDEIDEPLYSDPELFYKRLLTWGPDMWIIGLTATPLRENSADSAESNFAQLVCKFRVIRSTKEMKSMDDTLLDGRPIPMGNV